MILFVDSTASDRKTPEDPFFLAEHMRRISIRRYKLRFAQYIHGMSASIRISARVTV